MEQDEGKPRVGIARNQLGARVGVDIHPDGEQVFPTGSDGISVAPTVGALPSFLIPLRLRDRGFPKATGSELLTVWVHGDGPFVSSAINDLLRLQPTASKHGVIEPSRRMPVAEYQGALALTKQDWENGEP